MVRIYNALNQNNNNILITILPQNKLVTSEEVSAQLTTI